MATSTRADAQVSIDTIRTLSIDAIQEANSGHPGLPLAMAPAAWLLFAEIMEHNPRDPQWPDRDRFVLSAGHGSMLLYALLYLTGYTDMTLDELRRFREEAPAPCVELGVVGGATRHTACEDGTSAHRVQAKWPGRWGSPDSREGEGPGRGREACRTA